MTNEDLRNYDISFFLKFIDAFEELLNHYLVLVDFLKLCILWCALFTGDTWKVKNYFVNLFNPIIFQYLFQLFTFLQGFSINIVQ